VARLVTWVELVLVIATANRTNRVNDGLQTPLS
jgi:alkylhydroperoxidase family enzyme